MKAPLPFVVDLGALGVLAAEAQWLSNDLRRLAGDAKLELDRLTKVAEAFEAKPAIVDARVATIARVMARRFAAFEERLISMQETAQAHSDALEAMGCPPDVDARNLVH